MHLIFWLFPFNILCLKSVPKNTYTHVQAPSQLTEGSFFCLFASSLTYFHGLPFVIAFFPPAEVPLWPASLSRWLISCGLALSSCSAPACTDYTVFPVNMALVPPTLMLTVLRGWP